LAACVVVACVSGGCAAKSVGLSEKSMHGDSSGGRLIIKTGYIAVDVVGVDEAEAKVGAIAKEKAGYIVSSRMTNSTRYWAEFNIPAKELEAAMNAIAGLGHERSRSIDATDVTEEFVDKEAELANLMALRERMRELLSKTAKVEEILKVEEELNRIQTRIDSITGRLKSLKGKIDYSRLKVEMSEKPVYGPLGYLGVGVWWVIEKLFVIK
ncbi:MAG: DUF4349 domain-containing protein, partial [Nitrospira sp.]|nr:DUF4349 domain-containing protein [Nitrospira sp.]